MSLLTVYLTPAAEDCLAQYRLSTHGMALPPAVADELVQAGFVSRLPTPVTKQVIYGLTDAGAMYQDEHLGGANGRR